MKGEGSTRTQPTEVDGVLDTASPIVSLGSALPVYGVGPSSGVTVLRAESAAWTTVE